MEAGRRRGARRRLRAVGVYRWEPSADALHRTRAPSAWRYAALRNGHGAEDRRISVSAVKMGVVSRVGIEPTAKGLKGLCSTPELPARLPLSILKSSGQLPVSL